MRDPQRIDRIIDMLREEWKNNPDWRFGQLLTNIGYIQHRTQPYSGVPQTVDPFFTEDTELEARLFKATGGVYTDSTGQRWNVHSPERCKGERCVIHNPSNHHMRGWPTVLRGSKHGLVERTCPHGIGHSDPDSLDYFIRMGYGHLGIHGCDGCCREE